jgi:hypothetical protein
MAEHPHELAKRVAADDDNFGLLQKPLRLRALDWIILERVSEQYICVSNDLHR